MCVCMYIVGANIDHQQSERETIWIARREMYIERRDLFS